MWTLTNYTQNHLPSLAKAVDKALLKLSHLLILSAAHAVSNVFSDMSGYYVGVYFEKVEMAQSWVN